MHGWRSIYFIAPSGTGKSTHTRLWRETFGGRVWMIDDDKPLLQIKKDSVTAYGTPWNGKHHLGRNACAPLKAIAWLARDEGNHIEVIPGAVFFPMIFRQTYVPEEPAMMLRALDGKQTS